MRAASGGKINSNGKKQQQPQRQKTRMYHLSVKTISRANGSSAAAAAAYRSGQEVTNERTGEVHDYTRKQGVEHTEIVAPPAAPEWANNRSALWSAAEQSEKRKDATVAREFQVAIPKELTREQGIALVREFAAELVDKHRFAADIAIHKDDPKKWDGSEKGFIGYHAHILCSTRRLSAEGFDEKTRELDGMKAGREHVQHWRERWEIVANKHLQMAGHEQRIDHRSLKAQGIEREPTQHLGVQATAMERRGEKTELGNINRNVQQERQQSAADRQALAAITPQEIALQTSLKVTQQAQEKIQQGAAQPAPDLATLPMAEQVKAFQTRRDKIAGEREKKAARIAEKSRKRCERRDKAERELGNRQPKEPTGLFAGFKKDSYTRAKETWEKAYSQAAKLAAQAQRLYRKLSETVRDCKAWANGKMRQAEPELTRRIELHQEEERKRRFEQHWEKLEKQRGRDHDRGHGR